MEERCSGLLLCVECKARPARCSDIPGIDDVCHAVVIYRHGIVFSQSTVSAVEIAIQSSQAYCSDMGRAARGCLFEERSCRHCIEALCEKDFPLRVCKIGAEIGIAALVCSIPGDRDRSVVPGNNPGEERSCSLRAAVHLHRRQPIRCNRRVLPGRKACHINNLSFAPENMNVPAVIYRSDWKRIARIGSINYFGDGKRITAIN